MRGSKQGVFKIPNRLQIFVFHCKYLDSSKPHNGKKTPTTNKTILWVVMTGFFSLVNSIELCLGHSGGNKPKNAIQLVSFFLGAFLPYTPRESGVVSWDPAHIIPRVKLCMLPNLGLYLQRFVC